MNVDMRVRYPATNQCGRITLERDDPTLGHISTVVYDSYQYNEVVAARKALEVGLKFVAATITDKQERY